MNLRPNKRQSYVWILVSLLTILMSFQNCSPTALKSYSNGEAYEGTKTDHPIVDSPPAAWSCDATTDSGSTLSARVLVKSGNVLNILLKESFPQPSTQPALEVEYPETVFTGLELNQPQAFGDEMLTMAEVSVHLHMVLIVLDDQMGHLRNYSLICH